MNVPAAEHLHEGRPHHDHWVQFYETDGFLADSVGRFMADGLRRGDPGLIIATAPHRAAMIERIRANGVDVDAAIAEGRFVVLDAAETLATFMVDGRPDWDRLRSSVHSVIERIVAAAGSTHVRAYGEMVDLLWRDGQQGAALRLEQFWNGLRGQHELTLLCSYLMDSFHEGGGIPAICRTHSHVLPPESRVIDDDEAPAIAAENVQALVSEIARRTELESALRASLQQLRAAETEARVAKEDLEGFLDNAVVPIHRVDRTGRICWANRAELELLGYAEFEYVGRNIAEFHVDAPVISDILARLLRGETLRDYEARVRAKDGSIRYLLINSNALHRNGELVTTRCFSRDVTALKEAEADRDAVYRTSELLTAELDLDKVVHTLTAEATRLVRAETGTFCYTRDVVDEGLPPDVGSRLFIPVVTSAGDVLGGLFFGHSKPNAFTERDEKLVTAIAMQAATAIQNARMYEAQIAAREAAEAAEKQTLLLYRITSGLSRALSAEEAARVVMRETMGLIGASGAALLLVDAHEQNIGQMITEGESTSQAVAGLGRISLDADLPICEAARTGRPVWIAGRDALVARYPHVAELQRERSATWGALPLLFEGRTVGAFAFTCTHERPLTPDDEALLLAAGAQCAQAIERARLHDSTLAAKAQAEEASRSKDEFLAMLGHELRNPLSPILTAVQLMRLRGETSSVREQNVIERQVQHLIHLVDDLLDISRITRGKVTLDKKPLLVAGLVTKALEIAGPLCEERNHSISVSMPNEEIWLEADETRLTQVLSNLITNAAKYTPPGGKIDVRVVPDGKGVSVHVRDTGAGLGPDLLPRVFDLFVQGPRASDRGQGGLGIGLALVKSLVTMHGGTVSASSEGADRGTEMVVRLPTLEMRTPEAAATESKLRRRVQVTRRRILVVDDNEDAGALMGEMLRSMGHDVVVAFDGPRALEAVKRFDPEVAILDIGLPVMDGYELGAALRQQFGAVRLMALTGYGQEQDRVRTRDAGFENHFVKPVPLGKVVAAIEVDGTRLAQN